jgi:hypothetical protein
MLFHSRSKALLESNTTLLSFIDNSVESLLNASGGGSVGDKVSF